jgi:hypothetical protein
MRTIETEVYEFHELSKDAKKNAINYFRENMEIYLDFFNEDCVYYAKERGFEDIELQYSLGYCQGDGLSFSAQEYTMLEELYLHELGEGKEKTAKLLADNTFFKCTGNEGHYCFASSSDIDIWIENYTSSINTDCENINEVVNNVLLKLEQIYCDVCDELETRGYNEIEYQESDECIIMDIEANEYEFTKEGKLI